MPRKSRRRIRSNNRSLRKPLRKNTRRRRTRRSHNRSLRKPLRKNMRGGTGPLSTTTIDTGPLSTTSTPSQLVDTRSTIWDKVRPHFTGPVKEAWRAARKACPILLRECEEKNDKLRSELTEAKRREFLFLRDSPRVNSSSSSSSSSSESDGRPRTPQRSSSQRN